MRKLCLKDTVDFVKICKKAKLKDQINLLLKSSKNATDEEIGYNFIVECVFACAEDGIDTELYTLLAGIAERTPDEIASMSLEALYKNVLLEIAENNNLSSFFGVALKAMK